jgi:cyclopropane fatty-acyl-phospholipid synthase-like methyltransferase
MWDQRYDVEEYVYGTDPNQFLREHLSFLTPGMRVLSVADGEGRNGVWLAEQGMQVLSVDASCVAQTKARKLADERQVQMEFECADLLSWHWGPNQFDAVAAIFIQFANAAERKTLFAGLHTTLKSGGILLLHGYTPRQLEYRTGGPGSIEQLYTAPILRALLDGFDILELREHDSHISEGTYHHGMSALIDVVAKKR